MKPRSLLTVGAVLAGAVLAAGALAAPAAQDARKLVLQKSDLPGGARASNRDGEPAAASVTWNYVRGGKPYEVTSTAGVAGTAAMARIAFREGTSDLGPLIRKIQLPKYGDEQLATFHLVGGSMLVVRKGGVIWSLHLQTIVTRGGQTHELTRAEAIAEYRRFAVRVQRRVGNG
jgi:hypothetical protein